MQLIQGSGGGGGKSGGGGGGISQDPDTLSSVATARFVDLIGEGLIDGLVNGEYSIYLDGVPLRDLSGTPNYKPFTWVSNNGSPTQDVLPGFAGTESDYSVGVQLTVSAGIVVREISDPNADAVRVTVSVQGLSSTDSTGHVTGTSVQYIVQVRVLGGSWQTAVNGNISGKTSANYQRSHTISLTSLGVGPYEVAITRTTPDSTSALLVNALYWADYSIVNYEKLAYPNSACVGIQIDARYFSSVPARSYHVRGLHVRVPSNYNAAARTYSGTWDGTWITAYTNNPAWCYYDLVTNPRYGLGKRINDSQISKWSMYTIAQYCDQLVPTVNNTNIYDILGGTTTVGADGRTRASVPYRSGPYEPRFTLNVVINTLDDAFKVLNNLASVFRGMTYWASGNVQLTQDSPASPSMMWNNANVINGQFTYEGSSRSQRHTVALVGWNDPTEDFTQKFEYVEDKEGIARYGVRTDQIIAFGCTSRSQARRLGLYTLLTERLEKNAIKFRCGLDSARVMPGSVGLIMDKNRFGARWGGRVLSTSTNAITMDAPVDLPSGGTYTLNVMGRDGTIKTTTTNVPVGGEFNHFNIADSTFTSQFGPMAIWTMAATNIAPMQVRVINVLQVDAATYEITCVENEPEKYAAIDTGSFIQPDSYSFFTTSVNAITGLVVYEDSYLPATSGTVVTSLAASWDHGVNPEIRGYQVKVTGALGFLYPATEQTDPHFELPGIVPDTYTLTVAAVNYLGIVGPTVTGTVTVTGIPSIPNANVTNAAYTQVKGGVSITWDKVTATNYLNTEIHREAVWSDTTAPLAVIAGSTWTWPQTVAGSYRLALKHRFSNGTLSPTAALMLLTLTAAQVQPGDLAPGSVVTGDIASGAVDTGQLNNGAVTVPVYSYVDLVTTTVANYDNSPGAYGSSTPVQWHNTSATDTYSVDVSASWALTYSIVGPATNYTQGVPSTVSTYIYAGIVHADNSVTPMYSSPSKAQNLSDPSFGSQSGYNIARSAETLINVGPGDTLYVSSKCDFTKATNFDGSQVSTFAGSSFQLKATEIRLTALKR